MAKRLSAAALVALKEALSSIYWYKSELRSFLQQCVPDPTLLVTLNWENYKRQIVSDLVDRMCADQDHYLAALTRLCYEVTRMESFQHLEVLDGGNQKAEKARRAVAQLRQMVDTHEEVSKEEAALQDRQRRHREQMQRNSAVRQKLEELRQRFTTIALGQDPQRKGFELESLMLDLFELFDLDPKASFRNLGEQIDGAFSLDGTDYLFEAKWHRAVVAASDLDSFAAKVRRKLDNTLGLFLAINGFSEDGVRAHSTGRPSVVLMDGADLLAVLEERIDFVTLLVRKKRHAAQTGEIYLPVHRVTT